MESTQEAGGERNRSQFVGALNAEVGAEVGVGGRLGLSIRCKCPPDTSDLSHVACLERKAPPQSSRTHPPGVRGRALRPLKVPIPSLTGRRLGCRPAMNSLGAWSLHGVRKLC